ncbi:MAG TPA: tryptophan 7-halogenase [Candidatus Acidoferrum sp.]|nr:tryptophan 7-halogenase [Candidatus Acidoferrum sp.]
MAKSFTATCTSIASINVTPPAPARSYDVAIIGGALAGAATAILLLREEPKLRVLIVEKTTSFPRKVGEATVEVSAYFLGRVLGLTQYLNEAHLLKQGMRFWFSNERTQTLDQCSEIGGRYLARVAAYQVDRSTLDAEVLRRAVELGAELYRPASVQSVELVAGGEQKLVLKREEQTETIHARWVVDASGPAAYLARQKGWWRANTEHPTTSVWSRWRNVKDWDGYELTKKFPEWSLQCHGIRATATNHFMGDGWWAWCIPLKGGDVSIGVVFDQRRVEWPEEGSLGERLKTFLCKHPVAAEIMRDATWTEGDVHWRKNLPYSCTTVAGDGFVLVGDAAGFMDPFYSPGMDWMSFTTWRAAHMIVAQQRGEDATMLARKYDDDFTHSYDCWFRALYKDKYDYLGDFELMRTAFLLDLGLYYLGVAGLIYKEGDKALDYGVFITARSGPVFKLMSTYNRRIAAIACKRRELGTFGRMNDRQRFLFGGYTFERNNMNGKWLLTAFRQWLWLEVTEGWRSWFQPLSVPQRVAPAVEPVAVK